MPFWGVLFIFTGEQQLGEGQFILNPPMPEPVYECDTDRYNCGDFATQLEAQQCFDSCWVVRGFDVHLLDADLDMVTRQSLS